LKIEEIIGTPEERLLIRLLKHKLKAETVSIKEKSKIYVSNDKGGTWLNQYEISEFLDYYSKWFDVKTYDLTDGQLLFLHTPKTAGTSFRQFLEMQFHANEILSDWYPKEILDRSPSDLSQYKLICGHYSYAFLSCLKRTPLTVTFFRNPQEQFLSLFDDMKRHGLVPEKMTIEECLGTDFVQRFINFQTRWLSSQVINGTNLGYNLPYKNHKAAMEELSDGKLLDVALDRLKEISCFGIAERIEESMLLISYSFGFNPAGRLLKINISENRENWNDLSEDLKEKIRSILQLDISLYETATDIFEKRMTKITKKSAIDRYERYLNNTITKPELLIKFDQPINGAGWHFREKDLEGNYVCWTGADGTTTLDVTLDIGHNSDYSLLIRFTNSLSRDIIKNLKVIVNGREVDNLRIWLIDEQNEGNGVYTAIIGKEILNINQNYTRIEFHHPFLLTPRNIIPGSLDNRALGIQIKWINIIPANRESYFLSSKSDLVKAFEYVPIK